MAKVYLLPNHEDFVIDFKKDDISDQIKKQDDLLKQCMNDPFSLYGDYMDEPDEDGCIGTVLRFGVGDGYASYLVMKKKPLVLCYIPCPDGWQADDCTIRGVNWAYVKRASSRKKLFAW